MPTSPLTTAGLMHPLQVVLRLVIYTIDTSLTLLQPHALLIIRREHYPLTRHHPLCGAPIVNPTAPVTSGPADGALTEADLCPLVPTPVFEENAAGSSREPTRELATLTKAK
ncbi:hypothetical protein P691DRAFT_754085 [Macrolepiota fuliginosa MF-IS2]|uniref:Uncharacterized protein n=1 Tax=Macrolepiota fuliginosa MF-IS2 TaxID=1400762 RepID=A0A9P6CBB4_9AGAR|nr:hypothetical protein P691DRAFT_754085 [Macrolepiota fuliginosa MF-IS2]